MPNLLPSILRTLTPLLVSLALGWGAEKIGLTEETLTALATALVTAGYYVAARVLEEYVNPRFGWLLGAAKAPTYDEGVN